MNCKPGDLAIVLPRIARFEWARGRIVKCLSVYEHPTLGPCWFTEPKLVSPTGATLVGYADAALRPIRDPGEDARDETLDWLPVPTEEIA